ncbi:MAG: hypothetical protein V4633_14140 [Pseudomonadota bacterium]
MIDFPGGQNGPPRGGGEPPWEPRVRRLEQVVDKILDRLTALERDVAVIKATFATKSDIAELKLEIADVKTRMAESKSAIIMWVVSAIFLAQSLPLIAKWIERYL